MTQPRTYNFGTVYLWCGLQRAQSRARAGSLCSTELLTHPLPQLGLGGTHSKKK